MSEQTGTTTTTTAPNANGTGGTVAPEWAKDLPPALSSVVVERHFESPGDVLAALVDTEKAAKDFQTKATEYETKLKGFEGRAPNWLEGLDDKSQALIKTKGWGGQDGKTLLPDMLKSYTNLETAFGAEKAGRVLLKPKDANDKESRDLIYSALGRPENLDKYVYTPPQGITPNNDLIALSKKIAFESGMNQAQYEAMTKSFDTFSIDLVKQGDAESMEKIEAERATLTKEWGPKGSPSHERKMGMVKKTMQKYGMINAAGETVGDADAIVEALTKTAGHAATLRLFANIGEAMTESGGPGDEGGKGSFAMTPHEAKIAYDQRKLDKEWMAALTDKNHPAHKSATEERTRYLSLIHPAQQ